MTQQIINVGTVAGDNTGDPARTAFQKVNANFSEIYTSMLPAGAAYADTFTCNGVQTAFTLSANPGSVNALSVSLDGSTLVPGTDYTWTGTTLTLLSAPLNGQVLLARYSIYVGSSPVITPGSVDTAALAAQAVTTAKIAAGAVTSTQLAASSVTASALAASSVVDASLVASSHVGQITASYAQTAAEIAAGVTPTNYGYAPGNVLRYGADPTGTNDSTSAFQSAIAYANSAALPVMTGNSNRTGQVKVIVPAGQFKITNSIIQSTDFAGGITAGLVFEGFGNYLTTINYVPSGSSPLVYNNNKLLFVRFDGIRFYGTSASVDIIDSVSSGGAQDYRFVDCVFDGTWQYGVHLTGTNTNSEWSFEKCAFFGTWTNFLYSETSDQFLNYWFDQCKYWSSSSWLRFTKGGNIKISHCDVSGYTPSVATYLFSLEGATHSNGVCSFVCHATRFELKNTNAQIIYSEWPQGNILFSGCDTESQTSFVSGLNAAYFVFTNVAGPVIKWVNCSLMGTHTYASGGSGQYGYIPRISYDNCFITQYARPEQFLLTTFGVNSGGRPFISFRNCRGNAGSTTYETFESDQGWSNAARGMTSRKVVRVGAASTTGPISGGTETVLLPLNSVITKVWLNNPAGSTTNTGSFNFVIRTNEGTPTVLGTATGTNLSLGYAVTADLFFICSTDQKRTINVVDLQNITNIGVNYFLIEYIG